MEDRYGALVPGTSVGLAGAAEGPLAGTTFVAKDVLAVAGVPTGAGSPARRAEVPPAARSAVAVARLLAAGSHLVGVARSDELAYSLAGRNDADGSPTNPAAPGHLTGGSSSGSAAAVAGGLADVGLGTDTGGSVRVPAAHCGLVGVRPTHGRVPVEGMVPLAPSFDTVGWLTADAAMARRVGAAVLDGFDGTAGPPERLVVLDDLVAVATPAVGRAVAAAVGTLAATVDHAHLGGPDDHARWREAFRVLQGAEAWATHGAWLRQRQPALGAAVRARFAAAARIGVDDVAAADRARAELVARVQALVDPGTALVVPAAGSEPVATDADEAEVDAARQATLAITCVASLVGAPSLALPVAGRPLPVGLALVGRPGEDEALLALAAGAPSR